MICQIATMYIARTISLAYLNVCGISLLTLSIHVRVIVPLLENSLNSFYL